LSEVRFSKHLSDVFSIQDDLKQGDALSLFLLNSYLEYALRKVQEDKEGLEINGTHQLLICAINVKFTGREHTKKNTEVLLDSS
jgi:hypothetical protein